MDTASLDAKIFSENMSKVFSRTLKLLGPPAPSCPKCQNPLETLEVERYPDSIRWNRNSGAYEFSSRVPAALFICPNCKEKIGGRYGNGQSWGFDPRQANVIGQISLENEKEMLTKPEANQFKKRQERQEISM